MSRLVPDTLVLAERNLVRLPRSPDLLIGFTIQPVMMFTMASEIVAVEGDTAAIRVEVRYGNPVDREYRDLWIVSFADDGRALAFEERPFQPGQPYAAPPGALHRGRDERA